MNYVATKQAVIDDQVYQLQKAARYRGNTTADVSYRIVCGDQTFNDVKGRVSFACQRPSGGLSFLTQQELDEIGAGNFTSVQKIKWTKAA